mgnify:CR=1 FL=1
MTIPDRIREKAQAVIGEVTIDDGTTYQFEQMRDRIAIALMEAEQATARRCVEIAKTELHNTDMLLSSPLKSSAAWDIRNAISREFLEGAGG